MVQQYQCPIARGAIPEAVAAPRRVGICCMGHAFGNLGMCEPRRERPPQPMANKILRGKLCRPGSSLRCAKNTSLHVSLQAAICPLRVRCTLGVVVDSPLV